MKLLLVGLVPFYWILFRCVGVLGAGGSNGNGNGGTEYELRLDTRSDTNDCKYHKCDLDGVESHLLYTKSDHVVSKVKDGSTELWSKSNDLQCLGGVFSYHNGEKKLALLVLLNTSSTSRDPLQTKCFKYENNSWLAKTEDEYYSELKSLVPQNQNLSDKELDLSNENELAKFSEVAKSKLYYELSFYLPQQGSRLSKIKDGNNKVWERGSSNSEYGLSCLYGKKDDNNKFAIVVVKNGSEYEDKYFLFEDNQWKNVDKSGLKSKLTKVIAGARFRGGNGNGKKKTNGNGN